MALFRDLNDANKGEYMQCYLLAYTKDDSGNIRVLIAQKKLHSAFITNMGVKQSKSSVPDYAGQWVIVGGKIKLQEKPQAAGLRAFKEATGLDLASTFNYTLFRTETLTDKYGYDFSCTYVALTEAEAEELTAQGNINIAEGFDGELAHDEIKQVAWLPLAEARKQLNSKVEVAERYEEKAYQSRDWWDLILNKVK